MDNKHRTVLRDNRTYLLNEIHNATDICDHLQENNTLTNSMVQEIMAEKTNIAQNRKLLDTLPRRGPKAFDAFCLALVKTGQGFIAEKLDPNLSVPNATQASPENGAGKTVGLEKSAGVSVKSGDKSPMPVPIAVSIKGEGAKGSITPIVSNVATPQPTNTKKFSASTQPMGESHKQKEPNLTKDTKKRNKTPPLFDDDRLYKIIHPQKGWPERMDLSLTSKEFIVEQGSKDELPDESEEDIYPMSKDYTKRALIICNRDFDENYEDRKVADMDTYRLYQVLVQFGFDVNSCTNLTEQELLNQLETEKTQDGSAKNLSIFMLVILSYGGEGTVICKDNKQVYIQDIVDMFTSRHCPLMTGVPKVFLIQACGVKMKDYSPGGDTVEGEELAKMKEVESLMSSLKLAAPAICDNKVDTQASMHTSSSEQSLSEPINVENNDDILVAMATTSDKDDVNKQYSSQFLLGLCTMLCHYAKSEHFVNLLKGVNLLKEKERINEPMKLCEFKHSLTKKLYLMP
ncbi:luteolysis [Mactra antiquata]